MNPLEHKALVNHVARKWKLSFKRYGFDLEDLVQEGFVVCMKTLTKYDESRGYAFSTYFVRSLNNHFSNLLNSLKKVPLESAERGEFSVFETIEDESENPEEAISVEQEVMSSLSGMSPLARMMAEILIDPPLFVKEQFSALEAKRKIAQVAGVDERYPSELNSTFLVNLLSATGICSNQLSEAKDEIKRLESCHAV